MKSISDQRKYLSNKVPQADDEEQTNERHVYQINTKHSFSIRKIIGWLILCLVIVGISYLVWDRMQDSISEIVSLKLRPLTYPNASKWIPNKQKGQQFSLWDLATQQKTKYYKHIESKVSKDSQKYMKIGSRDSKQRIDFLTQFEKQSTLIDWDKIELSSEQIEYFNELYQSTLVKRRRTLKRLERKQLKSYKDDNSYQNNEDMSKGIRKRQIYNSFSYLSLTAENFNEQPELKTLQLQQKQYFQQKFNISAYPTQIPACIVVPSYNNEAEQRYIWNIESILQQQYSNFKVIIVVDVSDDDTANKTAQYLKWRKAPKDKVILIVNSVRQTAVPNFYYAVNGYCDYGEIFYTVDGDDELVGTQVLKIYNAIYQKDKPYSLYSNYLSYDQRSFFQHKVMVGMTNDYPDFIKKANDYKLYFHNYGHLRTFMTDIFFMINRESVTTKEGEFYWTLADNIYYFPAMELSCEKVQYIPELFYLYNVFTGINLISTKAELERGSPEYEVSIKKRYQCIDQQIHNIDIKNIK